MESNAKPANTPNQNLNALKNQKYPNRTFVVIELEPNLNPNHRSHRTQTKQKKFGEKLKRHLLVWFCIE